MSRNILISGAGIAGPALADLLHQHTRDDIDYVFADLARTRSFGLYTAYFTIPRTTSDERRARWYNAPPAAAWSSSAPTTRAPPAPACPSWTRVPGSTAGNCPHSKTSCAAPTPAPAGKHRACSTRWVIRRTSPARGRDRAPHLRALTADIGLSAVTSIRLGLRHVGTAVTTMLSR
ncbi:hypothetical protein [Amycolatopsis sp. cg9]|uniref:hypothetical protein n=1 Tax=Amycolatopsis sp. cg9 TaxID=3238801 RepID=UPI00352444CF